MAKPEASVVTVNGIDGLAMDSTGALLSFVFNVSNDSWHFRVHSNFMSLWRRLVSGNEMTAKVFTKRR